MKTNNQGSALAWTMAVLLGLSIFIVTTMTLSLSYMKRAVAANTQKQAYLTAKSGAQTVAEEIAGETAAGKAILAALSQPNSSTSFALFQDDAKMGDCQITVARKDKQLTVTALATMNKAKSNDSAEDKAEEGKRTANEVKATVVATLSQVVQEHEQMQVYYGGPVLRSIESAAYLRTLGDTDVYVKGQAWISYAQDNVVFSRNLIAASGVNLNNRDDKIIHIHQRIVSSGPVTLGNRVVVGVNPNDLNSDLCSKSPSPFSGIYTLGEVRIDGGVVYGNITAKSVILTNGARVEGDIHSAAEPQIDNSVQFTGKWKQINQIDNLLPYDFFDQLPEETLKPETIPQTIPAEPDLNKPVEEITNDSLQQGEYYDWLDLGKDGVTQYVVEPQEGLNGAVGSFSTVISNSADNPIYIYVKSGTALLFREIMGKDVEDGQGRKRKVPNVYFIVESGAELRVNYTEAVDGPDQQPDTAPEQYFYAFGKGKMLWNVSSTKQQLIKHYGAYTIELNQDTKALALPEIEYIPIDENNLPVIDGSRPPLDAIGQTEKWEITGYKRGEAT